MGRKKKLFRDLSASGRYKRMKQLFQESADNRDEECCAGSRLDDRHQPSDMNVDDISDVTDVSPVDEFRSSDEETRNQCSDNDADISDLSLVNDIRSSDEDVEEESQIEEDLQCGDSTPGDSSDVTHRNDPKSCNRDVEEGLHYTFIRKDSDVANISNEKQKSEPQSKQPLFPSCKRIFEMGWESVRNFSDNILNKVSPQLLESSRSDDVIMSESEDVLEDSEAEDFLTISEDWLNEMQPENLSNIFDNVSVEQLEFEKPEDSSSEEEAEDDPDLNSYIEQRSDENGRLLTVYDLEDEIRNCAFKHNLPHAAITSVLKTLKKHECFKDLCGDARTLLKTPRRIDYVEVSGGSYYHVGIRNNVEGLTSNIDLKQKKIKRIKLGVSIDGLSIFKSVPSEVYPIVAVIENIEVISNCVFPIGFFFGKEKPENLDFLKQFVEEISSLIKNGISLQGETLEVLIHAFPCDAPAASLVLSIKGHAGYASCRRCTIYGQHLRNRVCFPQEENVQDRTHESFVNKTDPEHHNTKNYQRTPLLDIPQPKSMPFDIVKHFSLDYMHVVLLGIMRTFLFIQITGELPHKLSVQLLLRMSAHLVQLSKFVPVEFARKPRSLKEAKRFKATEYRQLLLYTGPLVFKDILSKEKYENFLTLHVAMRIYLSSTHSKIGSLVGYARSLCEFFVDQFGRLYGFHLISFNFHALTHLWQDLETFGSLESCSAFRFENFYQEIKKLIRKGGKALQQIAKRIMERLNCGFFKVKSSAGSSQLQFKFPHNEKLYDQSYSNPQYKQLILNDITFKTRHLKLSDSCIALKNGDICIVYNFCRDSRRNEMVVVGKKFLSKEDFFVYPCKSSLIDIHVVSQPSNLRSWPISKISHKCVILPYKTKFVIFPLLHCKGLKL